MLDAVKKYATRILLLHVALLLLVVAIVIFAARQVYASARQQAIAENAKRLDLLADQTARGIENHYLSIMSDLELILRDESDPTSTQPQPTPQTQPRTPDRPGARLNARRFTSMNTVPVSAVMMRNLWRQLHGRVAELFLVNNETGRVSVSFSDDPASMAPDIARDNLAWFQSLKEPSMSHFRRIGGDTGAGYHLIAVPALERIAAPQPPPSREPPGGEPPRTGPGRDPSPRDIQARETPGPVPSTVVAMVPMDSVRERFFDPLNHREVVNAALLDDTGAVLISIDPKLAGINLMQLVDPDVHATLDPFIKGDREGPLLMDHSYRVGTTVMAPRILAFEPMLGLPGRRWTVLTSSPLDENDALVNGIFRDALLWAIFLTLSVTAVLVSTASFMIRGRIRLERIRHELLTRELEQARQIQLAWLPDLKGIPSGLEVSAANLPASHISGDFYNWFALPGGEGDAAHDLPAKIAIVIGDVTGHGMAAAFLMATTQLLVRTTLSRYHDPGRCLREVNKQLCTQGFRGQFVTMVVMVLDPASNSIEIATAGHPAPLVERDGTFTPLSMEPQLVLGVDPHEHYKAEGFVLEPGCSVLLYTDGVVEAESADGREYGVKNLIACLTKQDAAGEAPAPDRRIQMVLEDVNRFCHNQDLHDDVTLVALRTAATPLRSVIAEPAK